MADTDRELLEAAARAAGFKDATWASEQACISTLEQKRGFKLFWNPLTDDGDALRLAVKLGLSIVQQSTFRSPAPVAAACGFGVEDFQATSTAYDGDPYAATRRAIVRAAAAMASKDSTLRKMRAK